MTFDIYTVIDMMTDIYMMMGTLLYVVFTLQRTLCDIRHLHSDKTSHDIFISIYIIL